MNLVEVWFGIIEKQAIHRGTFTSVRDLTTKIRAFIDGWNTRSHPFIWTKTADQILAKADRKTTSNTAHYDRDLMPVSGSASGRLLGPMVSEPGRHGRRV